MGRLGIKNFIFFYYMIYNNATWISLRLLLSWVLLIGLLSIFLWIANEIVIEQENGIDVQIAAYLQSFVSHRGIQWMKVATFFGSTLFLLSCYLVLIANYIIKKKSRLAVDFAMIGLGSTGLLFGLKEFFKRQRPASPLIENVPGYSFPSGHSFSSFTFLDYLHISSGGRN